MKGHAEHDDGRYVPRALLDEWRERDPLARYRGWLLSEGVASGAEMDDIDGMTHGYAEEEAQLAETSPMPDPADAGRGVWAGDELVVPRLEIVKSPFAEA
jgi:TPP-dependent pyruvate/acetoin dehydrogenase alpha subunit